MELEIGNYYIDTAGDLQRVTADTDTIKIDPLLVLKHWDWDGTQNVYTGPK